MGLVLYLMSKSSSDEITWTQIGTDSTYTLTSSEEGKKIRAIYTDDQGFAESVTTSSVDLIDEGDANFAINSSGNKLVGDNLSITESSADPDGAGTLSMSGNHLLMKQPQTKLVQILLIHLLHQRKVRK